MDWQLKFAYALPSSLTWTVEEFHFLGDLGMFEGRRAMVIDGVLVEEGPMNPPHAIAATKTADAIRDTFGKGHHVRVAKPLVLSPKTDPEPDVAVVPGKPSDYTDHSTTALLVVEVSDSSLRYDTSTKLSLCAAGGIADYWVVDVTGRQLLVFRDPVPDATQPHGHGYATRLTFGPADTVSPLAAPNGVVRVADLLP